MNIAPMQANRRIFLRRSSQAALFLTAADAANAMPTTETEQQPLPTIRTSGWNIGRAEPEIG
jgi:hypothetical protein